MPRFKSQSTATIKIFIVLISVIFVCTVSIVDSQAGLLRSANNGQAISASADIYATFCAKCHGIDGRAKTAKGKRAGATDFTGTDWNTDDARAIRIITNGKGEMPAFKSKLSAKEIRSVWNHVRKFRK